MQNAICNNELHTYIHTKSPTLYTVILTHKYTNQRSVILNIKHKKPLPNPLTPRPFHERIIFVQARTNDAKTQFTRPLLHSPSSSQLNHYYTRKIPNNNLSISQKWVSLVAPSNNRALNKQTTRFPHTFAPTTTTKRTKNQLPFRRIFLYYHQQLRESTAAAVAASAVIFRSAWKYFLGVMLFRFRRI